MYIHLSQQSQRCLEDQDGKGVMLTCLEEFEGDWEEGQWLT